ncbi:ABC transporter permease, partial [Singulisphaera rosea]
LDVLTALLLFPAAVAFGGGGIAAAVSAVSRRGRDALLSVYFIDLILLIVPSLATRGQSLPYLAAIANLNPFLAVSSLVWDEEIVPVAISAALWLSVGLAGVSIASWRLAPSCLGELDGNRSGRKFARRRKVRPIDDSRPMLWKELYVDRVATLGGIGRWIGVLLAWLLGGGSLLLGAIMLWEVVRGGQGTAYVSANAYLQSIVGATGVFIIWLIEWGVGLRAAVTIASERERGTWDAILTSPLEAKEILRAKLWGSLYALRQLFVAAIVAWWIAAIADAIPYWQAVVWTIEVFVVSTFMAIAGLRSSLANATATKAMAVTIGIWLIAQFATRFLVGILYAMGALMIFLATSAGDLPAILVAIVSSKSFQQIIWSLGLAAVYCGLTASLFAYTQILFDQLAGRRSSDEMAVAAERFLHGSPADHRPNSPRHGLASTGTEPGRGNPE